MSDTRYQNGTQVAVEWRLSALEESHRVMQTERLQERSQLTATLITLQTSITAVGTDVAVIKSERKNFNFGMMIWMPIATTGMLWFFDHLPGISNGTTMIGHVP